MVDFTDLDAKDLAEPGLHRLNRILRDLTEEVNRLTGLHGAIAIGADLDMAGFRITNLGTAQDVGDALNVTTADGRYTGAALQRALEATGDKMLQTVRRLNDQSQTEQHSTFLNQVISTPQGSNDSTVGVVDNGGAPGSVTATVAAGTQRMADGTELGYVQRQDTITKTGGTSTFYYYYFRKSDQTLQLLGPYSADTSRNRMDASLDGRTFVSVITVPAAGVGGGSGGGGADPRANGGCTEIGTPLKFSAGAKPEITIEPCAQWIVIETESGRRVKMAYNTLVSVFKRAQMLERGDFIEVEEGKWEQMRLIGTEQHASYKQVVQEPVGKVYYANGVRLHNAKP